MQADILMSPFSANSVSQVMLQDSVRFKLDPQLPSAAPAMVRVRIGRSDTQYHEYTIRVSYMEESAHRFGVRAFADACLQGIGDKEQPDEQQLKDSLGCVSTEQLTDPSCPERLMLCFDEFGQRAVEDTSHSPIETIFIQDKRRLAAGGTPSPRVQVYFLTTITRDPSAPGSRHGTLSCLR